MKNEEYFCRVCGLVGQPLYPRWIHHPEGMEATYAVCHSCGADSGADDELLEQVRQRRQKWLNSGPKWWDNLSSPPADWNPQEQMKSIPPEWL